MEDSRQGPLEDDSALRGMTPTRRSRVWAVTLAAIMASALAASSAQASGVDPTRVSLPKGPGSIEGLATADFAPSLATGSSSYEVPIAVPPASAGFGPRIALAYDSGCGVTEIGIGWRITGTARVKRRTEDGLPRFDETDSFELVGLGTPSELLEVSPGTYRPSVEDGSFVRVQRGEEDRETWEARTKAGVTLRFGGAGYVESEGDHVGAYLLREERDRHGHSIRYVWDTSAGQALLERVVWNDFDAASTNELDLKYEARPDTHRLFSSGIQQSLTKRLSSIEVRHGGSLVRRYELAYGDETHPVLRSVELVGRDGTSRMPASRFEYTALVAPSEGTDTAVSMKDAPGRSPRDPDVAIADMDGDGLPDLLVGRSGQFRTYLNHDGTRWLPAMDWASASPSVSLSDKGVTLADLDADGAPDLVVKSGTDALRYFPRPEAAGFGAPVSMATVPNFSFEDDDVRLADMDGDRRTDVVITTKSGVAVGYNRAGTDFTEPAVVGVVDTAEELLFSNGHTSLCDINGDRVADLCSLHSGGMAFFLGRGRGIFEKGEEASGVPEFDASAPYRLADIDGDGWDDLVRVGVTGVDLALAIREGHFAQVRTLTGTPERTPATVVEFADMNGSGSVDIVWVDVTGDGATSWRYLDLFPNGRAGLLRRIDNGLGKIQTIEYEPAALSAARARDAGKPWSTRINVAMRVVASTTTDLTLGDPPLVTEFGYADGAYDPKERTFAGFGGGTKLQLGDAWTPTLVTAFGFDTGLVRRELRGAPLTEETRTEAGTVFSRTTHGYTSRSLATAPDGRAVGYSFKSSELVEHVEGGAESARSTLTEYEQDDYGNVTLESRWGEVAGKDASVGNDEAIVVRTFANDPDEWLLGNVVTEELTDGVGKRVALTRRYYDGTPFLGLPLGDVTRGEVSREEAWVGPGEDAFELVLATKYDADGLPSETRDARGGGRFFEWARDHTSIRSERVKLESKVVLTETAEVDGAFGTLLRATDYGGSTTAYEYDAFGRLTKIVKSGDSPEAPTVKYGYVVSSPLSRIVTESRVISGKDSVERSETLLDGGGRERATLTRDGDRWILAGVSLLDARGGARRTLLPRATDAAGHAAPPLFDATPRGSDTFHDALGREIRTRSPSGIETRTEYAPFSTLHWDGGQTHATSAYEHTPTIESRDGLGRAVSHTKTLNGRQLSSSYAYDASGALVGRTDPEGHSARYDHDGRGRRVRVLDPDLGEHRFTYDATGNVIGRRYPDGATATFTFDLGGRALTEDWNGDGVPEITRTWDVSATDASNPLYRGKLARVAEPGGSVEHTYDARGRITSTRYEIAHETYTVRSEYDAQDRETLHVYPDGSSLEIRRNERGQIARYGAAVDFTYGEDGLETERRFSTGVVASSGYDEDRRRSELTFLNGKGSVIEHLRWTYDTAGNLAKLADLRPDVTAAQDRSETYLYDNLYRLVGVHGTWGKTDYRYSPSGNLLGRTSTVPAQALRDVTYGERPHAPTVWGKQTIEFDARGRMTNDGVRAYTWNEVDQLVAVSRTDGGSVESIYGDDGVRRSRIEHRPDGTSTTTHFIDAWSEVTDGKLTRYIVHGGQRIVKLASATGVPAAPSGMHASRGAEDVTLQPGGPSAARAANTPPLGLLCVLAFALTVVTRKTLDLLKSRRFRPVCAVSLRAAAIGGGLAIVAASTAPSMSALGIVLLAALCTSRIATIAKATRCVVALIGVLALATACGGGKAEDTHDDGAASGHGSIHALSDADTLIATDLLGSVLGETTGTGGRTGEFAAYPFGATRYDTSHATWKFAGNPRDGAVGLDHMGARFYAPELGVWTSGDPAAVTDPERLVTADFAAANPYAYAKQSPLLAADRDGHFWHVAIGAALGALIGGGMEAGRQYFAHGKVEDWGRVGAAAAGGAVAGTITALNPAAGLVAALEGGAVSNAASGVTERLVASHGKSAGSLADVAIDAAVGAVTAGVARGAGAVVKRAFVRKGATTIDTAAVRFTQSSVKSTFSDGRSVQSTIEALKGRDGDALAREIPAIRIFEHGGALRTLDNRRLLAFSEAGRQVPYVRATKAEIAAESWKLTATPQQIDGWFIRVK